MTSVQGSKASRETGRVVRVRSDGVEGGAYDVLVERGILARLPLLLAERVPASSFAVVSDEAVGELYGRDLVRRLTDSGERASLFPFPPGERAKTRATWADLTDRLLEAGLDRDGVVVALGGGVTGDLAGFVAATCLRGVRVAQVPTSVVAMVDSAVGGKTGVDVPAGKNLVGAFHPPSLVAVDPDTAGTLPREERRQGLAEVVKHGAIRDEAYLREMRALAPRLLEGDPEAIGEAVARSVEIKAEVVAGDERESGLRRILNFGHTVGHAVEAVSGYGISHGSAVAMGMVAEARLGEALGVTEPGTAEALEETLRAMELPTRLPVDLDPDSVLAATRTDKKGSEGRARYVLLGRLGGVDRGTGWVHRVGEEEVGAVVRELLEEGGP